MTKVSKRSAVKNAITGNSRGWRAMGRFATNGDASGRNGNRAGMFRCRNPRQHATSLGNHGFATSCPCGRRRHQDGRRHRASNAQGGWRPVQCRRLPAAVGRFGGTRRLAEPAPRTASVLRYLDPIRSGTAGKPSRPAVCACGSRKTPAPCPVRFPKARPATAGSGPKRRRNPSPLPVAAAPG